MAKIPTRKTGSVTLTQDELEALRLHTWAQALALQQLGEFLKDKQELVVVRQVMSLAMPAVMAHEHITSILREAEDRERGVYPPPPPRKALNGKGKRGSTQKLRRSCVDPA